MNNDYDQIEEKLKEEYSLKKKAPSKQSGRSVFKLKEIIQKKAQEENPKENKNYFLK